DGRDRDAGGGGDTHRVLDRAALGVAAVGEQDDRGGGAPGPVGGALRRTRRLAGGGDGRGHRLADRGALAEFQVPDAVDDGVVVVGGRDLERGGAGEAD